MAADIKLGAYNQAVDATMKHLNNAVTLEPRVSANGFSRTGMSKVVTSDSLDRYIKANKIKGKEKDALLQSFTTIAGAQSAGENLTVIDVAQLKKLTAKLKGFAKTHNKTGKDVLSTDEQKKMGKTAQALIAAAGALKVRKFTNLQNEQSFAKNVDTVLEHLLVKANTGSPYLHWYELVNYSKKPSVSADMKDALWKSFRYIGRTMTYGETNSTQICIDQRQEAQRILMKLFAGNSTTKAAINDI